MPPSTGTKNKQRTQTGKQHSESINFYKATRRKVPRRQHTLQSPRLEPQISRSPIHCETSHLIIRQNQMHDEPQFRYANKGNT
jgi:hypothetical protein